MCVCLFLGLCQFSHTHILGVTAPSHRLPNCFAYAFCGVAVAQGPGRGPKDQRKGTGAIGKVRCERILRLWQSVWGAMCFVGLLLAQAQVAIQRTSGRVWALLGSFGVRRSLVHSRAAREKHANFPTLF